MEQADFFTGLLPFVLAYILFFVALKQIDIFDDDNDRFAALVSVIFAFFVARFVASTPAYQEFFVDYLGFIAISLIGLLGLMAVISFVGLNILTGQDNSANNLVGLILTVIVLAGFFVTGGAEIFLEDTSNIESTALAILAFILDSGLIWVLIVLAIIAVTMRNPDGGDDTPWWDKYPFFGPTRDPDNN